MKIKFSTFLFVLLLFFAFLPRTQADDGQFVIEWDPNPTSENVAGYKTYWGTTSGTYSALADTGTAVTYKVNNLLPGGVWYFVVTAYGAEGLESPPSNEITVTVPFAPQALATKPKTDPKPGVNTLKFEDTLNAPTAVAGYALYHAAGPTDPLKWEGTASTKEFPISGYAGGVHRFAVAAIGKPTTGASGIQSMLSNELVLTLPSAPVPRVRIILMGSNDGINFAPIDNIPALTASVDTTAQRQLYRGQIQWLKDDEP